MSTKNTMHRLLTFLKSRLLLRLWCVIMLLVALAIIFLWVVQIVMFEPNYVNATIADLDTRTREAAQELEATGAIDPENNDNALYYLSKSIKGKVFLVDASGEVLFAYNRALITDPQELAHDHDWLISGIYKEVVAGEAVGESRLPEHGDTMIIIGVPATYQGEAAAIILYSSVSELTALQVLNRQQLLMLSVLLTLVASLIAFILARNFTKPILNIQQAVDQMAKGDFTAVPDVRRADELGQLSASVEILSAELQRVDVLRKEVIANVSHELRAPLSLITGYSEMVRDITGADETARNRNMDLIIREAHRLSAMVDDIMDYSQLQAGYAELKLSRCSLGDLVQEAVDYARSAAAQYNLSIVFKNDLPEIFVDVDPLKMSQVLRNLLNNAINHTENGQTITVSLVRKAASVRVLVTNPGEPIPEAEAQLIWERYKRIQHQGGRREGTGIGLAIVSTILKAHNLKYGVTSGAHYNCFWFAFDHALDNDF